ncbi:hypothetical protein ACM0L0_02400 [Mycoplasma sp. 005V]|uniref:hypothetical protein n=1 Tax=Mycoplasma sp. 005V TaxID=3398776 RepID=UPI003A85357D
MKKIKNILYLTALATAATFPMVSSSCNHKDEKLELNGQTLYKNAQLAANYNQLKKSNVNTINNINLLFQKNNSAFNKKISINASAFIDWTNVEKILKYNEKYNNKEWYNMLVGNLYHALMSNGSLKDSLISNFKNKNDAQIFIFNIREDIVFDKNNNLANAYILNNYIKYILNIIEWNEQGQNTNSLYWISNLKDILQKLVIPSAYIIDPIAVENNSNFLTLKNNNIWDILKNKNQYMSTMLSPFDLTDDEFEKINEKDKEESKKLEGRIDTIDPGIYDRNHDDQIKHLMSITTPGSTILSWKLIIKELNLNEDNALISLEKEKIIKDDNYFLNIKLRIPNYVIKNYKIESINENDNKTSVKINFDNAIPLSFESFKDKYGELIRYATAYTIWMNITALKPFDPKPKDIDEIDFKYYLLLQDSYSSLFFNELLTKFSKSNADQTSLDVILPLDKIKYSKTEKLHVTINVLDHQLPLFYKYEELENEYK